MYINLYSTEVSRVRNIATMLHQGQTRKYTGDPYINHPVRVAEIVADYYADDAVINAALLHDVLEDTHATQHSLTGVVPDEVIRMVMALTNVPHSFGNRKERKQEDKERLARSDARIQTIKVADLIDNTDSIVMHDPKFAEVYLEEKSQLLDVLTKAPHELWLHAQEHLERNHHYLNSAERKG